MTYREALIVLLEASQASVHPYVVGARGMVLRKVEELRERDERRIRACADWPDWNLDWTADLSVPRRPARGKRQARPELNLSASRRDRAQGSK